MPSLPDRAVELLDTIVAARAGGVPRESQRELTRRIAGALSGDRHAIAEAPTGTGKSFAYLAVVAALVERARRAGGEHRPVIICTATKALQAQLVTEDLPVVADAVGPLTGGFRFELLKGRSNYLCRARFAAVESGADQLTFDVSSAADAASAGRQLDRIAEWVPVTVRGDRDELNPSVSDAAWSKVSIGAECPGRKRCSFGDDCFAEQARDRARAADVTVVNAALYAADMASAQSLLGEHDVVVVDEAHVLDAAVTDAFTTTLSSGQAHAIAGNARRLGAAPEVTDSLEQAADSLAAMLNATDLSEGDQLVDVSAGWSDVLANLSSAAATVASAVESSSVGGDRDTAAQVAAAAAKIAAAASDAAAAGDAHAAWVHEARGSRRELVVAPIDVSGLLGMAMWGDHLVVATSATLAHGGSLDAYARRVGAHRGARAYETVDVPSPFDFRANGVLFVAKHLPDPRDESFTAAAQQLTAELIVAAGGRTLALFTSHRALQAASAALSQPLADKGIKVICQGDAPRDVLVGELRDSARTGGVALFATQSFWTGVDVPGDGLLAVILDKLPFARPNDPLSVARRRTIEERGGNAFAELDVPRAGNLLAQGAGRLIRSVSDRGVVAVMDRRLAVAGYRDRLLAGLPPFRRSISVPDTVAFLNRLRDEAAADGVGRAA